MILPGFIDSHLHVLGLGYITYNIDLTKIESIPELVDTLKNNLTEKMIIGRGWNQENLKEKRMPTKADLNLVSEDIPIVLVRACGHVLVVNDKMLELAQITDHSKQVFGGHFSFETGIFSEKALALIYDKMPLPGKEELRKYFITANKILLENGITSVASDDFCIFPIDYELVIETLLELYQEDKIQVKITEQVHLPYEKLKDFISKGYVNNTMESLRMGPLKILADGSLGGKTAFLNEPYKGEPDNRGISTYSDEELYNLIHLADSNNMDVVVHAIGDGASDQVIEAIAKSLSITNRTNHAHAIIHAQLTNNRQIEKMFEHQIGAIVQPIFLNSDIPIIEERIGNREKESYLFKTMYKKGINVGFSTDSPIEPVNPFYNIYVAMTRKSIKMPDIQAFNESESFTLNESLECYLENNLKYIYQQQLPAGDYIVIDKELDHIEVKDLLDINIKETYVNNKLVYSKNEQ